MLLRGIILGITFIAAAEGQGWTFGLAGGGSLTNGFETITTSTIQERTFSQSKDYLVGPTIEYRLPWNFSVAADALFRELHMAFAEVGTNGALTGVSPAPVVTWEFPVLGKYRFHSSRLDPSKFEPFIEAGPSFRTTGNLNAYPSHYGAAAGVGVETYWKGYDIAPVLRYTRWAHDPPADFVSESKSNQLELLVAISRLSHLDAKTVRPDRLSPGRFSMGLIIGTSLVGGYPNVSAPTTVTQCTPIPGAGCSPGPQIPATAYQSSENSLNAGPALEFALPKKLYLEIDALHHPLCRSDRIVPSNGGGALNYPEACGVTWEVPLLAKYKFGTGRLRPFVYAGPSVRTPFALSKYGLTAGAGVEARVGLLKIAPQIRYTRWGPETNVDFAPVTRNQILFVTEFML